MIDERDQEFLDQDLPSAFNSQSVEALLRLRGLPDIGDIRSTLQSSQNVGRMLNLRQKMMMKQALDEAMSKPTQQSADQAAKGKKKPQ